MDKIVKRNNLAGVLITVIILILSSTYILNVHAEACDHESGVITDYNSDYYDSYEEAIGDDPAYFNDENINIYDNSTDTLVQCATVEESATYLRRTMVARSEKVEFIFSNPDGLTGEEGFKAIKAATFAETDSPKEGDYLYWNYVGLKGSFDQVDGGMKYTLYPSYHSTLEQEIEIDDKIASLLNNEFKGWDSMSEFEIIKMVYTWITDNFVFVSGSDRHSTYSGIIEKKTVCQGFATTEYRLLREMGVSCRVVANDSHGWNIVKIGDCYYNIDATWDVGLSEAKWENFLLTNENFEKGEMHSRGDRFSTDEFNSSYPMATEDYIWEPSKPVVSVEYRAHVQSIGWQTWVNDGGIAGTQGQSKRLEGINVRLVHSDNLDIDVEYMSYIQSYGWESDWNSEDALSGTIGKGKRLEAIKLRLTGDDAEEYDIYYRVHARSFGWLGWVKDGAIAGTTGMSKRLEAIQIQVLPKGQVPAGIVGYGYISYGKNVTVEDVGDTLIDYKTHVQTYGWQNWVSDGSISGTYGEGKRLEAISIKLNNTSYSGGIMYRSHIQTYGWEQEWCYDGENSGTSGEKKRLEAIQIKLYGELEEKYDVYYRVHVQTYGWQEWVKNGEIAGTEGQRKRLEAIQIVIVPR